MYSNTASFGKICAPCIQKAPQSAVGEYTARTSCHQGAFSPSEAPKPCTAHESCHPPPDGLAPAQGLLPEQLHRGIAFQRLGPCPGVPAPLGAAKGCAARDFPDRRRNACRAPLQQMLDAIALSTIESVLALNIRACLCWHKMEKWTRRGVSIAFRLPLF